ncbi:MAG: zf-HC2 domain-containing protein, partial [Krumholzibacteria bacterium]|nr:zf-HC2 domain-containing protein [Candidatus Krumholzibacteria bacterium]
MADTCQDIRELLAAQTLHELAERDRAAVAAHLEHCTACHTLAAKLRDDDRV